MTEVRKPLLDCCASRVDLGKYALLEHAPRPGWLVAAPSRYGAAGPRRRCGHYCRNCTKSNASCAQGTLAKWKKQVGDKVMPGDILAEIQTVRVAVIYAIYTQCNINLQ